MEPEKAYQLAKSIKAHRLSCDSRDVPDSVFRKIACEFDVAFETVNGIWHDMEMSVHMVRRKRQARYRQGHSISV